MKLEDLEEIKSLPENRKKKVVDEYNKGYHFLLSYGKLIIVALMMVSLPYINGFVKEQPLLNKVLICAALGHGIAITLKMIEINIIAKKVIHDLIKDIG